MNYDELIKALRCEHPSVDCESCEYNTGEDCNYKRMTDDAANAIEEQSEECRTYKELMCNEHNRAAELAWEKEHQWIPVTDRLPEHEYGESTSVLTVDLYGVMRVTYFDGGNWCWPSGEALTTMRVAPITHWMHLPQPPKEETE